MRVGILTSHRVPCGIAQYSERFATALGDVAQWVEPVILAGRADEHRSVPEEWDGEVHDVARIGIWSDDGQYSLDTDAILGLDLDVLHVQYQGMLFWHEHLRQLCDRFPGVKAITYHDNCQQEAPGNFDLSFTHRWNVGPGIPEVIPFGIEVKPPVVRTFGLGRTRADYIGPICRARAWVFESAASHEPIQGGGQSWRTHEQLIEWLRGADAVVLWYDEVGQAGSSQAARTAMASRRPVITNDTTWFSDLPARIGQRYTKVGTLEELEEKLVELFGELTYIKDNSWAVVAERLVNKYQSLL